MQNPLLPTGNCRAQPQCRRAMPQSAHDDAQGQKDCTGLAIMQRAALNNNKYSWQRIIYTISKYINI